MGRYVSCSEQNCPVYTSCTRVPLRQLAGVAALSNSPLAGDNWRFWSCMQRPVPCAVYPGEVHAAVLAEVPQDPVSVPADYWRRGLDAEWHWPRYIWGPRGFSSLASARGGQESGKGYRSAPQLGSRLADSWGLGWQPVPHGVLLSVQCSPHQQRMDRIPLKLGISLRTWDTTSGWRMG